MANSIEALGGIEPIDELKHAPPHSRHRNPTRMSQHGRSVVNARVAELTRDFDGRGLTALDCKLAEGVERKLRIKSTACITSARATHDLTHAPLLAVAQLLRRDLRN